MAETASFEEFKKCAVSVLSVDDSKVTMEAKFNEDLGADSLDLVEFVMELEKVFGVNIDESELDGVETVGQAYELVTTKQSA